ncbi:hypothetical protein GCM10012288_08530 [Malaciobacter pacificus]|uniref:BLUF domain-containing protein n=1 Tax=Malaciobacter pacificus TaxID=1080223 RepID=A0A5C2HD79_9BACT|nr:BLUF domain-containing protein [Malaciobacter pacificus]QEP35096.1 BLUF domain-containing protein [Malaciobacter pacificus]GGD36742.1 hypothetical protein GCM10012288_08530 [Malaciobacter pacificus]
MYRLMYMSTANKDFSTNELESLLKNAKKSNENKNITGLLVVKGRTFLQCLEGEKSNVLNLFNKIKDDSRHRDVIELLEEETNARYFPNWSMGFKNIKNLTNIKSEILRDFTLNDERSFSSNDVSEIFLEFIESN